MQVVLCRGRHKATHWTNKGIMKRAKRWRHAKSACANSWMAAGHQPHVPGGPLKPFGPPVTSLVIQPA
jgi:hypothetical protein